VHCFGETAMVSIAAAASRQELEAQMARLERELQRLKQEQAGLRQKLAGPEFLSRAPETVVEKTRAHYAEVSERCEAVAGQLAEVRRALEGQGSKP
jgi:valyl-tRNA synthetase